MAMAVQWQCFVIAEVDYAFFGLFFSTSVSTEEERKLQTKGKMKWINVWRKMGWLTKYSIHELSFFVCFLI